EAVPLDNGRQGGLHAKVRLQTSGTPRAKEQRPAPLLSYLVVPMEGVDTAALLPACAEVAATLSVVAWAITVETSFEQAEKYALSMKQSHLPDERRQERAAHYFYEE